MLAIWEMTMCIGRLVVPRAIACALLTLAVPAAGVGCSGRADPFHKQRQNAARGEETANQRRERRAEPPPQDSTTPAARPRPKLADAVEFYEHREYTPTTRPIGSGRGRAQVDYMSDLEIRPNKDVIKQVIAPTAVPLTEEERAQIQQLEDVLDEVRHYLDQQLTRSRKVLQIITAARDANRQMTPQEIKAAQDIFDEESATRGRLLAFVRRRAVQRAGLPDLEAEELDVDPAVIDRYNAVANQFVTEDGRPVKINTARVAAFIREEIEAVVSAAAARARKNTYGVRISARSYGQQSAVLSVKPYNDVEDPRPQKAKRIGAGTEQERQLLAQAFESNAAIAKQAESFKELVRKFSAELRQWLNEFGDAEAPIVRDEILKSLRDAAERFKAEPTLKPHVELLTRFASDVEAARASLRRLGRAANSASTSQDVLGVFFAAITDLENLARLLDPAQLRKVNDALAATVKHVKTLNPDQDPAIKELQQNLTQLVDAELKKLLGSADPEKYPILKNILQQLQIALESARVAEGAALEDPTARIIELDELADTTVHVGNTVADRGDRIEVTTDLFRLSPALTDGAGAPATNALGEPELIDTTTRAFAVDRFDWSSTLSANLIFVNRQGDGEAGDPDVNFRPAPAAAWTLHYREPIELKEPPGTKAWRFFDPGFGFNVAALSFDEDSDVQIGMGVHATLFNDILIVGYGWNLQAEEDRAYFFLGISILDTLRKSGGILGSEGK